MPALFRLSFLAVGVLTLSFCTSCKPDSATGTAPPKPPLVTVAKVQERDLPITLRAPLDLRPLHAAEVGSKTLGYLDAVLVERGDHVKRGQILALVRPSDLPDQLAAARGALAQSQASAQLARTNFDRAQLLAPRAVVSQAELQQARSALATSVANEAAAQAQIAAVGVRLGETRIVAPMAGVVAQRRLDPGALVGPAQGSIMTVVRLDVLRAFVNIGEMAAAAVSVGLSAEIELDAFPGKKFAGRVVRVAPGFDMATRTLEAELQMANESGELRTGMYGRATLVLGTHPKARIAPSEAVINSHHDGKNSQFVYVHKDGAVRRRTVTVGFDGDTFLEILKGLEPGEDVVVGGLGLISEGARVRAVPVAAGPRS